MMPPAEPDRSQGSTPSSCGAQAAGSPEPYARTPALPDAPFPALRVRQIFVSPGHNYFGRYGQAPDTHEAVEMDEVECVPGRGLRGDRFFGYRPDYKGQVTFFSEEVWRELLAHFRLTERSPSTLRRNVIVAGGDLNALIGRTFTLQGVGFEATEECRPCHWMNQAVSPGAEDWLKGRGGLRCRVISGGVLRRDP